MILRPKTLDRGVLSTIAMLPSLLTMLITMTPAANEASAFTPPPIVTVEGRTARLMSDTDRQRLSELDAALASPNHFGRVLTGVGGLIAGAPLYFGVVQGVTLVVELISWSPVLVVIAPFAFPIGLLHGLATAPVLAWAVAGVGLAIAIVGGLISNHEEARVRALRQEREAILAFRAEREVVPGTMSTVATF